MLLSLSTLPKEATTPLETCARIPSAKGTLAVIPGTPHLSPALNRLSYHCRELKCASAENIMGKFPQLTNTPVI